MISTYTSNLHRAMRDNLFDLIMMSDAREITFPVFSFDRDCLDLSDGMKSLRIDLLTEDNYLKVLNLVDLDWMPFELHIISIVDGKAVELKVIREAEAHLHSDYFSVLVSVDKVPQNFFEIAMNVETGFYSVNHEYERFDEDDNSIFDVVCDLFAQDVLPHMDTDSHEE